jgi:hypothetical protein
MVRIKKLTQNLVASGIQNRNIITEKSALKFNFGFGLFAVRRNGTV